MRQNSACSVPDRLDAGLEVLRAPEEIVQGLADIVRFRLLMIAAGYEDGNHAVSLRRDPIFKMALEQVPSGRELCS